MIPLTSHPGAKLAIRKPYLKLTVEGVKAVEARVHDPGMTDTVQRRVREADLDEVRHLGHVPGAQVLLKLLLQDHPDVVLHAEGDWVLLPPSPCLPGVVHWRVKPGMCGWELPRLEEVTDAVLTELDEVRVLAAR